MKASIIDGFPNEFKQRDFKAGIFFPKWKMKRSTKAKHTVSLNSEKEICFPCIFLKQKDQNLQPAFSLCLYLPLSPPPLLPSCLPPESFSFSSSCPSLPPPPFFSFKLLKWLNDLGSKSQTWHSIITLCTRIQYPALVFSRWVGRPLSSIGRENNHVPGSPWRCYLMSWGLSSLPCKM